MKNFLFLVFIALLAIAVLLFLFNPQFLQDIWLWIVGLIGVIISGIKKMIEGIADLFKSDEKSQENKPLPKTIKTNTNQIIPVETTVSTNSHQTSFADRDNRINELEQEVVKLQGELKKHNALDSFVGTTLTVIRYVDDGETTLGLLFLQDKFFCYTLEDTYRNVKVKEKTRIPKGTYNVDFNRNETGLTLKYRKTRSWFVYHLHVQNVKGFQGIYIHSGSTHEHTEGCLLVASGIYSEDAKSSIFNSKVTFERLYKTLKPKLDQGEKVRIKYIDENFMSHSILSNN